MALIPQWLPPTEENWALMCRVFQLLPIFSAIQFLTPWYPMGKTSIPSRLNFPGKIGWFTMEIPGALTLLYTIVSLRSASVLTMPSSLSPLAKTPPAAAHATPFPGAMLAALSSLPPRNQLLAALFTTHYVYRAVLAPLLLNPSMSPIHVFVWACAAAFQVLNGVGIGGWIAGYGAGAAPDDGAAVTWRLALGTAIWAAGLAGNVWHDGVLRDIRRQRGGKGKSKDGERVYEIPERGLFKHVLYAHYLCEWVEWVGFWIVGGWGCVPARTFLVNDVAAMLPRAVQGRRWYWGRFGRERVGQRWAVLPGVV